MRLAVILRITQGAMRSPYDIHAIQINDHLTGILREAQAQLGFSNKETVVIVVHVQQPLCLLTGSLRSSKSVQPVE